jgi:hypothetical protein
MQSSTITPPASHARGRHLLDGSLPPVGEQQEHIGPQHPHGGYPHDVVYPGDYYRERDRAGSGYPVDPVVVHHTGEHPQETVRQEDPTNGIPWTPGGDQSAYQREDQEEYPSQQTRPTIALRMAAAEPGRERDKFSAGSPRLERRSRPRRPSLGWSRARLQRWAWFGGGRSSRFTWRPRRRCCWFVGLLLLGVAAYRTRLPGRLRVMPLAVVALVPASVLLPAFTTVGMPLVTSLPFIGAALLGWFLLGSIDGDGLAAPARAESGIATATRSAAGTVSSGVGKMRSVRREREGGAGGAPAARGAGGGGGCP